MSRILTIGDIKKLTGDPEWAVRRAVDSLMPPVQRFGQNRMVPRGRLAEVRKVLRKRKTRSKQLAGV